MLDVAQPPSMPCLSSPQVAVSDRSYVHRAYALLMEALASLLTRSPDPQVASKLLETAEAHGGASEAVLLKLAEAFTSCCEPLRALESSSKY